MSYLPKTPLIVRCELPEWTHSNARRMGRPRKPRVSIYQPIVDHVLADPLEPGMAFRLTFATLADAYSSRLSLGRLLRPHGLVAVLHDFTVVIARLADLEALKQEELN